ncbi:MAG: hypothetical protein PHQ28_07800 [Mycobacterium sp.]|nr:hypothetical protein [Mycobacterium sp.]
MSGRPPNRYTQLLEHVFQQNFSSGDERIPFSRSDIETAAETLGIDLPKNLGDVVYAMRYRTELPASIRKHAPKGKQWVIRGVGRARYEFAAVSLTRIVPTPGLVTTKIPDATPEILLANRLGDEQALLALVRYNRLIDTFLGITSYSLQNHLRTSVRTIGQVEVDEIYLAVDKYGAQYVIPVQAKGGSDQIGVVQTEQDLAVCAEKFPQFIPRPVVAQFMADDVVALFELTLQDDEVRIVDERHYKLVESSDIAPKDIELYRRVAGKQ